VVFDAAVGVGKASISLYLPCMIRGGNLAATNGPEPSNSWSPMSAPWMASQVWGISANDPIAFGVASEVGGRERAHRRRTGI
jgi:hypothetical protein